MIYVYPVINVAWRRFFQACTRVSWHRE